jgi:hypothetical protein
MSARVSVPRAAMGIFMHHVGTDGMSARQGTRGRAAMASRTSNIQVNQNCTIK